METEESNQSAANENRDRLLTVLETLEHRIAQQNSLKYSFLRGAVYGLGTVVGASILVALFGGIIATVLNQWADEPVVSERLEIIE
jgi:hypothetical protein